MTLTEGTPAPQFTAQDEYENEITLSDWTGTRVVLYFYPEDDTPGCTIEAQEFRDTLSEFTKKNARIFGVSRDSCVSHQAFIKKYNLNFPLLADTSGDLYDKFQVNGRTTFVIDEEQKIQKVFENVQPRGHSRQILNHL